MPDSPSPRETHRSFTVRVPMSRYLEVSGLATEDKVHLNTKINELLTLGLGGHLKLNTAIARFVKKFVEEDAAND